MNMFHYGLRITKWPYVLIFNSMSIWNLTKSDFDIFSETQDTWFDGYLPNAMTFLHF